MTGKHIRKIGASLIIGGAVLAALSEIPLAAAPNPCTQENVQQQERAPESLVIRVRSVRLIRQGMGTRVSAEATVDQVHYSESGLKPGSVIFIGYDINNYRASPWIFGNWELPILQEGEVTPAFLKKVSPLSSRYILAAGYMSFSNLSRICAVQPITLPTEPITLPDNPDTHAR